MTSVVAPSTRSSLRDKGAEQAPGYRALHDIRLEGIDGHDLILKPGGDRVGSEMPDEHDPIHERGQDERHVSALRDLSEVCQSLLTFHYLLRAPRRSGSTDTENGRSRPTKIGRSTCD